MTETVDTRLRTRRFRKLAEDILALSGTVSAAELERLQFDAKTALDDLPRGKGSATSTNRAREKALASRAKRYNDLLDTVGPIIVQLRAEKKSYSQISDTLKARGYKPLRAAKFPISTIMNVEREYERRKAERDSR